MKRKALRLLTALLNVDGVEIPANDINVDFYTGNVRIDDKELHLVAEKVTEYRPVSFAAGSGLDPASLSGHRRQHSHSLPHAPPVD